MQKLTLLTVFLLCWVVATGTLAQVDMNQSGDNKGPEFHIDVANMAVPTNNELSRLFIYIEVVYDELQFIKIQDGYEANYEITAVVFDKDNFQVDGKIWRETVTVNSYDQTNDRNIFHQTHTRFDLESKKYKIVVSVLDVDTEKSRAIRFNTELREFPTAKTSISDILFLREYTTDSLGIKSINPVLTNSHKGLITPAFAYLEIYNPTGETEAQIEYKIKGINTKFEKSGTDTTALAGQRTLYAFRLPVDSLRHDTYNLNMTVKTGKKKVSISKSLYIRFQGIPFTADDIETAIKQCMYIATVDEWKQMKNAPDEKKLEEFKKFWKRHDPTPGTEVNEAMDSHYNRVEYANQQFSVMQREGWQTDRGMVYIVLGPPDDVVRDPYPSDSRPWQVWNYYRINRQFEFLDFTGFGDYRFYQPYSMYELQLYLR
ncbi:MAG TPA: GWxTD domain-containing protein [bacterium]|nr:GWxTD domain-containing protein [bacterium]HPN42074.1 GWxTD domain-containing protein [bacterium]